MSSYDIEDDLLHDIRRFTLTHALSLLPRLTPPDGLSYPAGVKRAMIQVIEIAAAYETYILTGEVAEGITE